MPTLLFGRLYLPQSMLEALAMKRLTPELSVQLTAVSQENFPNGGTMLGTVLYDEGTYNVEGIASTDSGLLGLRGLYNFGGDASPPPSVSDTEGGANANGDTNHGNINGRELKDRIYGRFSAGGEIYYGTLNKSGGVSIGARFATLPAHRGTPLTATLTVNPLMGSLSATYAVAFADACCALATKLDFNVYSYESDWAVGAELWSRKRAPAVRRAPDSRERKPGERSFQARMEWRLDDPEPEPAVIEAGKGDRQGNEEETKNGKKDGPQRDEQLGVLKARLDQHLKIGVLWEGRVKSLLFSLGTNIDLRTPDQPFRSVGLGIQYSS